MSLLTMKTRNSKGVAKAALPPHLILGRRGEQFALEYLKQREGYLIVARNFAASLGRNLRGAPVVGEIDIVAYDRGTLAFVEVKTRTSEAIATAAAALDRFKQRTIARTARAYRRLLRLGDAGFRFDLVTVVFGEEASPAITLHRGCFTDRVTMKPEVEWWS
jgi:putative endonuclease